MRQAGICVWQAHQLGAPNRRAGRDDGRDRRGDHRALSAAAVPSRCSRTIRIRTAAGPRFPPPPAPASTKKSSTAFPTTGRCAEGDIVSVDTGCRLNGWCGDAAVTYPVGRIAPAVQQLLDVTSATLDLAFELMHTKTRWSQVAREMAQFVRDNGFSTVECFVGHGIGRQMHEEPQVPNFLSRSLRGSGDFRIEPGLVIAVEPMVNMGTKRVKMHRDHWTQSTLDRKPSAHFEHTIAVTKDGPVLLTSEPTAGRDRRVCPGISPAAGGWQGRSPPESS